MIGHYVEDDELDAFALTGMLNHVEGISLTTSASLTNFSEWADPWDLDFVLVDIYRPDSISLKSDVEAIRSVSRAPVFFVTGDDAEHYYENAIAAGAQGVLEKEGLDADRLLEALGSVSGPIKSDHDSGERHEDRSDLLVVDEAGFSGASDPSKVQIGFRYLSDALSHLASSDANAQTLRADAGVLADATRLISSFAQVAAAPSKTVSRPAPRVIREMQRASLGFASRRGVKLVFQISADVLDMLGNSPNAVLGIRSLLSAAILGSPAKSTVSVNGMANVEGVRISLSSTEAFQFDLVDVHEKKMPAMTEHFQPTVLMTAASLLLGLTENSFTIVSRGSLNSILVDIPG